MNFFTEQEEIIKHQTQAMKLLDCIALDNDIYTHVMSNCTFQQF